REIASATTCHSFSAGVTAGSTGRPSRPSTSSSQGRRAVRAARGRARAPGGTRRVPRPGSSRAAGSGTRNAALQGRSGRRRRGSSARSSPRFWHPIPGVTASVPSTIPTSTAPVSPTLLDTLLPRFDHRTIHGRPVDAPLDVVARAIRETPLDDARLARALLAVRTFGRSWRRRSAPIAELGDGEAGFIPRGDTANEVVLGFAGRPWPRGGPALPLDAQGWRDLVPTDVVKVGFSVRCTTAVYGTLLITETRIVCGPRARTTFDRYWLVIRPGSDLVRGSLLRAIARQAELAA